FNDVDLCYAISAPLTVGIAALRIKRKFSVPYFFEVGDLWPDAPIDMGIIKNSLLKQSLYTLEKRIYRHSKAVVALSPPIRAAIEKKIPGKKTHLVPNMADTEYYKPGPKDAALEKKFGVEGKFVVSYIGALGVANGLDYFLECARVSQRVGQPVHFLICGDGAMLDGLTESVKRLQLKNLTILPFQNRDGVRDIMNVTDAAFTCYKPVRILETGSPNKYFDGLAAGKLIVINFSGWIKEEIEQERCGVFIDPKQPTDFAQKIEAFLKNTDLLRQYQQAARSLAERKYSRKILGQTFARAVADWKSL
ncbi:MAG: glycosyltransferase family 4 protein, partial [Bacteroidota bacterium]